jgi:hypothetical protein
MKRLVSYLTASTVFLFLSAVPALAQHGNSGGGGGAGQAGGAGQGGGMGQGSGMGMGSTQGRSGTDMGRTGKTTGMNQGRNDSGMSGKTTGELLTQNTKLSSNLQSLLPKGTDMQEASSGFKNLGDFVAAVHVSKNLDIPFSELKDKVNSGDSLGKAIHELKPDANAKAEAKKAKKQAKADLKDSGS